MTDGRESLLDSQSIRLRIEKCTVYSHISFSKRNLNRLAIDSSKLVPCTISKCESRRVCWSQDPRRNCPLFPQPQFKPLTIGLAKLYCDLTLKRALV